MSTYHFRARLILLQKMLLSLFGPYMYYLVSVCVSFEIAEPSKGLFFSTTAYTLAPRRLSTDSQLCKKLLIRETKNFGAPNFENGEAKFLGNEMIIFCEITFFRFSSKLKLDSSYLISFLAHSAKNSDYINSIEILPRKLGRGLKPIYFSALFCASFFTSFGRNVERFFWLTFLFPSSTFHNRLFRVYMRVGTNFY